jgi:hypothetical protein
LINLESIWLLLVTKYSHNWIYFHFFNAFMSINVNKVWISFEYSFFDSLTYTSLKFWKKWMHLQEINTKWFWILFWIEVGSLNDAAINLKFKIGYIIHPSTKSFHWLAKSLFLISKMYVTWNGHLNSKVPTKFVLESKLILYCRYCLFPKIHNWTLSNVNISSVQLYILNPCFIKYESIMFLS